MRRVSLTLAVLATGAIAGCGESHTRSGGSKNSSSRPLTVQQARRLVGAVGLTAADVPGFSRSGKRSHHTPKERRLEAQARRCAGGLRTRRPLAEASSGTFEQRQGLARQSVSSEVSVAPSDAVAAQELAQARSGHVRACLTRYLDGLLGEQRGHGLRFLPVRVQYATPPAAGATGSYAMRVTTAIAGDGGAIPLYLDILGFVDGPVQVSLTSFGFPLPFTASIAERLFTLLLERTESYRAHKR